MSYYRPIDDSPYLYANPGYPNEVARPYSAVPVFNGHASVASGNRPYTRKWWFDDSGEGIYQATGEDRVCMNASTYNRMSMRHRDYRVLHDPLYPALDRTRVENYSAIANRNFNLPTQVVDDTYRLVGYLVNNGSTTPTWKLFGRLLNRNAGDFYMIPANGNDIKVPITNEMIIGREKLRDFYTIPDSLTFRHPLLDGSPYTFVALPRSDLQDLRYV